jgi:hypothetical protein
VVSRTDSTRGAAGPTAVPIGAQAESSTAAPDNKEKASPRRPTGGKRSRGIENSIQAALERSPPRGAADKKSEPPNEVKRRDESSAQAIPGHFATRYVQVGNKYHFANGELAITDHGNRLSTPLENSEVIADLIETAKLRGWTIEISGTKAFKAEVWQQANLEGVAVRGYHASKLEEALLERRMGKDREAPGGRDGEPPRGLDPSARPSGRASATEEAVRESAREAEHVPVKDGVYTGRLIKRAAAPYRHDPNENLSYYVTLQPSGRNSFLLWGQDLERAINESLSKVKVGDEVSARFLGSEPVTVTRPVRDEHGQVVREALIETHRNRWSVETTEFLRERSELAKLVRDEGITKEAAVRKHPLLAGVYTELHAAKLKAKEQYQDPADQQRFVASTRERLAQSIERGERLPATRVQTRAQTRGPSSRQERDLVQERVLG